MAIGGFQPIPRRMPYSPGARLAIQGHGRPSIAAGVIVSAWRETAASGALCEALTACEVSLAGRRPMSDVFIVETEPLRLV